MRSLQNWIADVRIRKHLSIAATLAAFSLLLLCGCGRIGVKQELPSPTPDGARKLITENANKLTRYEADFSFSFQAMLFKGTFFGQSFMHYPDRFAASLKAPLGIRAGDLVVIDGKYELNLGNGQVMDGDISTLDLMSMTGIPLPTDDLLMLFDVAARPPAKLDRTLGFEIVGNDSLWVWRLDDGELERQIELSPREGRVLQESWIDREGSLKLKKTYLKPEWGSGAVYARQVRIAAQGKLPVVFDLTVNRIALNPKWKESPFRFKWTVES